MKLAALLAPLGFTVLMSCQGTPEGKSTPNDNTALKAPDSAQLDTAKLTTPKEPSYAPEISDPHTADLVRLTLKDKYKADLEKNLIDSFSRKFSFFSYDLNDDGKKEIFVWLTGQYFCGSGGCSPLILDDQGETITQFSVSEYPIVVDNAKTKGWKDLFITSGGKFHVLKFNGKKYPSNPSVQPVLKTVPGDGLPRLLDTEHEPYPTFTF